MRKKINEKIMEENSQVTSYLVESLNGIETVKSFNGEIITKELTKLVNDVFDVHYGFNRRENINLPNIDENVDRQHLRYEAIVDENNIIHRR